MIATKVEIGVTTDPEIEKQMSSQDPFSKEGMIATEVEIGATTDLDWHEVSTMDTTMCLYALLGLLTSSTLAAGGRKKIVILMLCCLA